MSRLTGSILLSVLFSVGLAALPLLLHTAFNTLLDDYDTQQLVTWGAATLGSVVVFAVLYAWKASTDSKLVAMVQQEARQRVLIAVQQGPIDQANRDVRSLNRRVLDAEIAGDATRHVPALILDLFLVVASGMVLTFLYWPIAVAVLMINVCRQSPPVPQVSSRC